MCRIFIFLLLLTSFASCESKLGKFEEDVLYAKASNDTVRKVLKDLDTNQLLKLRGKSKAMLLNFNIELGNDTLDMETAGEIDGFIRAYRATDFFTTEIRKLRKAQEDQQVRLQKLQSDIENDAGVQRWRYRHQDQEEYPFTRWNEGSILPFVG